jgi:hypothetical protein
MEYPCKRIVDGLIQLVVERKDDGLVNQKSTTTPAQARHIYQFSANKLDRNVPNSLKVATLSFVCCSTYLAGDSDG